MEEWVSEQNAGYRDADWIAHKRDRLETRMDDFQTAMSNAFDAIYEMRLE